MGSLDVAIYFRRDLEVAMGQVEDVNGGKDTGDGKP
jgi:hypothetical protein